MALCHVTPKYAKRAFGRGQNTYFDSKRRCINRAIFIRLWSLLDERVTFHGSQNRSYGVGSTFRQDSWLWCALYRLSLVVKRSGHFFRMRNYDRILVARGVAESAFSDHCLGTGVSH